MDFKRGLVVFFKNLEVSSGDDSVIESIPGLTKITLVAPADPYASELVNWVQGRSPINSYNSSNAYPIKNTQQAIFYIEDPLPTPKHPFILHGQIQPLSLFRNSLILYKSCPEKNCKKKVTLISNTYFCPNCKKNSEIFKYRYCTTLILKDSFGVISVTAFDEIMEKLLNTSAVNLCDLIEKKVSKAETLLSTLTSKELTVLLYTSGLKNQLIIKQVI